ncbi:hypothetical protein [Desulfopila aestuarii]|nr:hypothetical protein [Desulfopila aestuarii]
MLKNIMQLRFIVFETFAKINGKTGERIDGGLYLDAVVAVC